MTIRFGSAAPGRRTCVRPRSAAKRSCARATMASSARSAAGTQLLRRVAKGLDLGRGGLPPLELLAAPVDPDHRDVNLEERRDVGVVAARDVHPALLAAEPAGGLLEVGRVRLVAADLLRRDYQFELSAQVAPGHPEELVVDV